MAGDPFEDAFVTKLNSVIAAATIAWSGRTSTTPRPSPLRRPADAPAANAGWFELEFLGGDEAQSHSAPRPPISTSETGQVTISAVTKLRAGASVRDLAGLYLDQIRTGFRSLVSAQCQPQHQGIVGTMPMGSGEDEAGNWVKSLGLRYEVLPRGLNGPHRFPTAEHAAHGAAFRGPHSQGATAMDSATKRNRRRGGGHPGHHADHAGF